jgi:hypothetical protein
MTAMMKATIDVEQKNTYREFRMIMMDSIKGSRKDTKNAENLDLSKICMKVK